MIDAIVRFSISKRFLVLLAVLIVAAFGAYNYTRLPIDAVPDITNVQVQINTAAPGYSPLESEQRITFPVETAMGGLPRLDYTRSISRYGLSQVTVAFKDGTDIYFARQLISERLQQVRDQLPPGVTTEMGPISTGLGEIDVGAVLERHRDLAQPIARDRAGIVEPGQAAHGGFDRKGYALLAFQRRIARRGGVDLHLVIGDVRYGVDGQARVIVGPEGGDGEYAEQDEEAPRNREADDGIDHGHSSSAVDLPSSALTTKLLAAA